MQNEQYPVKYMSKAHNRGLLHSTARYEKLKIIDVFQLIKTNPNSSNKEWCAGLCTRQYIANYSTNILSYQIFGRDKFFINKTLKSHYHSDMLPSS